MKIVRQMAGSTPRALRPDLFGSWGVVREWGRIGRPGCVRVDACADLEGAEAAARRLARSKRQRGYGQGNGPMTDFEWRPLAEMWSCKKAEHAKRGAFELIAWDATNLDPHPNMPPFGWDVQRTEDSNPAGQRQRR